MVHRSNELDVAELLAHMLDAPGVGQFAVLWSAAPRVLGVNDAIARLVALSPAITSEMLNGILNQGLRGEDGVAFLKTALSEPALAEVAAIVAVQAFGRDAANLMVELLGDARGPLPSPEDAADTLVLLQGLAQRDASRALEWLEDRHASSEWYRALLTVLPPGHNRHVALRHACGDATARP